MSAVFTRAAGVPHGLYGAESATCERASRAGRVHTWRCAQRCRCGVISYIIRKRRFCPTWSIFFYATTVPVRILGEGSRQFATTRSSWSPPNRRQREHGAPRHAHVAMNDGAGVACKRL